MSIGGIDIIKFIGNTSISWKFAEKSGKYKLRWLDCRKGPSKHPELERNGEGC